MTEGTAHSPEPESPQEALAVDKKRSKRVRGCCAVVGLLFLVFGGCLLAVLPGPLPFSGPRSGLVLDAATGKPVTMAVVEATWTCYDSPMPLSHQSRSIHARSSTKMNGTFTLKQPPGRRGLMGTDFVVRVKSEGYIEAVFILDPSGTPLPAQTVKWPFASTSVLTAMPKNMTVRLKPALPVLVKAAKSPLALIRDTALEELEVLSRQARPQLRKAAAEALKKIKATQEKKQQSSRSEAAE